MGTTKWQGHSVLVSTKKEEELRNLQIQRKPYILRYSIYGFKVMILQNYSLIHSYIYRRAVRHLFLTTLERLQRNGERSREKNR